MTGASRGIGRGIAQRLAADGAHVFVNYRRGAAAAESCVAEIARAGGSAETIRADVGRPADLRRMINTIARKAKRLGILVANAGVAPLVPDPARVSRGTWEKTFATNVTGAFLSVQSALPLLRRAGSGRIIFIGSVAARLGGTIGPHYAASKAALVGLMEYLSRIEGRHGVTVNVVEPGYVITDLSADLLRSAAQRRRVAALVPLGRIATVAEIAATVAFLAGPDAAYVSRQRISVSGGR